MIKNLKTRRWKVRTCRFILFHNRRLKTDSGISDAKGGYFISISYVLRAGQPKPNSRKGKKKKKRKKEEINCNGYLRIVANGIEDDPGQTSWQLSCGSSPASVIAR